MALRCVLFDLDEVLADYDRTVRLSHLAHAIGSTTQAVYEAVYGSGIEDAADSGMLTGETYLDALSTHLDRAVTLEAWTEARRTATIIRPYMLTLAAALSKRQTVAILTNNSVLLADQLHRIAPSLFPLFEGRAFASAQFGARKPEPLVYTNCLAWLGVSPSETLFIDDNAANIDGAREAGLLVHHYTDYAGLEIALASWGL